MSIVDTLKTVAAKVGIGSPEPGSDATDPISTGARNTFPELFAAFPSFEELAKEGSGTVRWGKEKTDERDRGFYTHLMVETARGKTLTLPMAIQGETLWIDDNLFKEAASTSRTSWTAAEQKGAVEDIRAYLSAALKL